mmetsp:Transcript_88172/g.175059  ORF Transcript_88172/g.175059 Transcript_88172/m.175059 type:complete len:230 (-) Transcript_88172:253-942(-)
MLDPITSSCVVSRCTSWVRLCSSASKHFTCCCSSGRQDSCMVAASRLRALRSASSSSTVAFWPLPLQTWAARGPSFAASHPSSLPSLPSGPRPLNTSDWLALASAVRPGDADAPSAAASAQSASRCRSSSAVLPLSVEMRDACNTAVDRRCATAACSAVSSAKLSRNSVANRSDEETEGGDGATDCSRTEDGIVVTELLWKSQLALPWCVPSKGLCRHADLRDEGDNRP